MISVTILPLQYPRWLGIRTHRQHRISSKYYFGQMLGTQSGSNSKIPNWLNRRDHAAFFFHIKKTQPPYVPELTEVQKDAHLRILISQTFHNILQESSLCTPEHRI